MDTAAARDMCVRDVATSLGFAAAVLLSAPGCMVGRHTAEGPDRIDEAKVDQILEGGTSREWILATFGPPDAVVRPGAAASKDTAAAAALELFTTKGQSVEGRCVYLYASQSVSATSGAVLLAVAQSTKVSRRRLWVLIDDASGIVVDRMYRED